ncbi:MAG: tRNA (N6-isopentenyl adenosine(37)-C2)-methylthiotransferase MiaB [Candidatus Omnitrophota bacterium]
MRPGLKTSWIKVKKILLKTFGCQMNTYDSQVAAGILEKAGFEVILDNDDTDVWTKKRPANVLANEPGPGCEVSDGSLQPRLSLSEPSTGREVLDKPLRPDIVLMNTCSVRDHAEERVWGRLGMLGVEKKERPELVIGLMGCMVEEHREKLFKRFPYLDLMVGTRHVKELPEMIRQVYETRKQATLASLREDDSVRVQGKPATRIARIKQDGISIEYSEYTKRASGFHAWLPIMTGCNKACTFCIVPLTRGSEVSMPAKKVYREAERLVADGVKWITLLGQNVNSYVSSEPGVGSLETKKGVLRTPNSELQTESVFPKLLETLCGIEGLERLSFTTSHPQDATEELFQVVAKNPKIGRRFHLPLQSGSDRMLKRMKRLHTYADFKAKIDRLRELVPEISITTDIIVGFSGETEDDHLATRRALEEIRFDGAFIYKYSVRPGTPAAQLPDDVPAGIKSLRNQELLAVQKKITDENSRAMLGKERTVFVEGRIGDNPKEQVGRLDQDRRVIFEAGKDYAGQFVRLELTGLHHETFRAKVVQSC